MISIPKNIFFRKLRKLKNALVEKMIGLLVAEIQQIKKSKKNAKTQSKIIKKNLKDQKISQKFSKKDHKFLRQWYHKIKYR